jgi:hypothetical protein
MPSVAASERGRAQTGTAYEQVCAAVSGLYDLDGGGYRPLAGLGDRQTKRTGTAHQSG